MMHFPLLNLRTRSFILVFSSLLLFNTGCGKSVKIGPPDSSEGSSSSSDSSVTSCGDDKRVTWTFMQPDPSAAHSVDILFVVDTSLSLADKRAEVADKIPDFLNQLPADWDYRIGVMLAHGGASSRSGRLYSNSRSPLVLNSKTHSVSQIQSYLSRTLLDSPSDADEANGEALLYSLSKSLGDNRFAEIQNQGFYRNNAALATVMVTDENDICYPPELNGFSGFPDFVRSIGDIEMIAYKKYCQNPAISPLSVYSLLKDKKGEAPLTLAGVVHTDAQGVPKGENYEDAIGHGILEFLDLSPNSIGLDIGESSFSSGLATIGTMVSSQVHLKTDFKLSGNQTLIQNSVQVKVDQKTVPFVFQPSLRSVQISVNYAGKSRSTIEVSACKI